MTEREWNKLCRNIFERKCILMIGSEFQIEIQDGNIKKHTTFNELLIKKVSEDILQYRRLPEDYSRQIGEKDFCQIVRDFIAYSDNSHVQAREELETLITDYLFEVSPELSSEGFSKLATLPLNFIIDTNYSSFFLDQVNKAGKFPKSDFYHFKSNKATFSDDGTDTDPFLFSLYGSAQQPNSLVITDYDMIQFLSNIISKSPALPPYVRAKLIHEETSILFLGFGILAKNWYFRLLLHALTMGNKKTMSFALEYLSTINDENQPAILFFKDELKVCLYHFDQESFIDTLTEKYQLFYEKFKKHSGNNDKIPSSFKEEIKVFISYKREDLRFVKPIVERLEAKEISVYWDHGSEFIGDWKNRIEKMIEDSDAFILLQSKNLRDNPVNFLNKEIRLAIERASKFPRDENYLYPAYIDTIESKLTDTDFKFINAINNWDLSVMSNVDKLAIELFRNQERLKKSTAR
ncbi:toll/interleukin-1 receptor domain-containing protein [Flavitalea sp.]|nr:toll/interleukin-1 receptor domain-containing protein [Flavitalea sp.]